MLLDIALSGARRTPYTIEVELLFQPIGYRWIENLRSAEGPEIERFLRYTATISNEPVVVGRAEAAVAE